MGSKVTKIRNGFGTAAKVTRTVANGTGKVMNQCLRLSCLHNGHSKPAKGCRCCAQGHPARLS